jgi:predicted nucleotidyltransferase
MEARIKTSLTEIEQKEAVQIFYACESGSRAWGFPSTDSDYDVRFLYIRPRDWYLSVDLEKKRDVIEVPITDELDVSGWDIRKALMLLKKSNPPLLEWLNSPIIYRQNISITNRLRDLLPDYYSPVACFHHYLNMANGNFKEYLKGDVVWVKKYFYVLRPLLAIKWIEECDEIVPMTLGELIEKTIHDDELRSVIADLIELKQSGAELDRGPAIPRLSQFMKDELDRLGKKVLKTYGTRRASDKLNVVFRASLTAAWGPA